MGPGKYNCDDLWQKDGESQPEVAMWTADFEVLRSEWQRVSIRGPWGRVAMGANLTSSLTQLVEAGGYLLGRLSEVGLEPPFLWWTYFPYKIISWGFPA